MLEKVKAVKDGIIIAGDGRHDSMGHCAKYGAYTIFWCTIPMILHFSLIQRNQAGSSPAMEFMGFKSCMEFLIGYGLLITAFVSDRHVSIAAYMKKSLTAITHYFDIWHLKKKIRKVLSKLSKENGCECIAEWIKPCENHLYWSATTTFSGNGLVIWAKFRSFMSHIINKHSGLSDPLFSNCFHGVIQPRKWLKAGSQAYEKLCSVLNNINLVKGIKQASPFAQTSCLEGFHSVLNHFAPKMIAFSYVGMYCRHILAAVHFNFNLHRDVKRRNSDNTGQLKFTYPKFKNGEATVRDVRISLNFDYVEEIFQTFLSASSDDLKRAIATLKELSPLPMNSMLQRESKTDAVKKKTDRSKRVVEDVPPTTPVDQVQEQAPRNTQAAAKKKKAPPKCSLCGHPTKGHNKVTTCPKNQRKQ